ncbi:helix-turn-helix domain-containing protein [Actinophytocola sp.]|uniref:nSTAND1 domain-containing NTPase n=1 Tax=Actinophytocola sp. TaxID=1872138 RepID=UPI002ED14A80
MRDGDGAPRPATVGTKKDFGLALTAVRESAGLTVRDLARRVDVPLGTISGWCTGRHLPTLSQKDMFLRLLATCGVTEEKPVEEWLDCWLRLRRPLGQQRTDVPTPYRGLEPFQPEHADWFFGRSRLTETLVHRVTSGGPGMVVAVGSSGSGKSSLLRAGLLPALCGNGRWQGLPLTPGPRPTSVLAARLAMVVDLAPDAIEAELRDQPALAARRVQELAATRLLLVVDQLEELFTATDGDVDEQGTFLDALLALAANDALRVVAAMRADFYPDALRWPVLASALQDNQVTVGSMTDDELRQAIVEPARLAGVDIESGLVDVLLRDLTPAGARHGRMDTGALPLLSHALLATWEQGRRRTMSVAQYVATGGIHGAVATTAESVFTGLTESDQSLARQLFLRLVHVGDGTPDTRRRVRLEELTGGREESTTDLLGRYVDRRLITADVDGVEISHEALLDSWPRLRDWIDTDRSGLRLHRNLTEAARSWQDADRDPGALYRGMRLDAAVDWVTRRDHRDELNQLEQEFVDASVSAARAERVRERRGTRRLRWLAAALGVLLLLSAGTTVYSIQQRAAADRERNLAISRQVAGTASRLADSDPALAAQLAVAAYRIAPTVEARSSLLAAASRPAVSRMVRPGGAMQAVAVDPEGTLLAAAGAVESDTEVLLWDLRDPLKPKLLDARLTGHGGEIYAVTFSPDGAILVTGSTDNTVRLWDVSDRTRPRQLGQPLTGPLDAIVAVEFSPDGNLLAVGSRDRAIQLWDLRDRERPVPTGSPLTGATGAVQSIAFTPAGDVMAVADAGGAVRVWNVRDRQPLGAPLTVPSRVNAVAFSPDGTTLAAGSNDANVRLWTMTDPARPAPAGTLTGVTGWVNAIAFSADGTRLASANSAARVQVWDLATQRMVLDLPHPEPTTAVAFRDDDRVLYTNSTDGIARRWLVPGPVLPTEGRQITGLAFHPDRPLLIDGGTDQRLWDVTNRDRPTPLGPALTAPPDSDRMTGNVTLSPDGDTLAGATRAGNTILFWDVTEPDRPRQLPVRLTGHTALIEHVAFSHHGRLLASTSDDGTVRLWDTADVHAPTALATLDPAVGFVYAAAFSQDDETLAAVTQDGYLALWDVRDPRRPTPLRPPVKVATDDARSLAISPDNRTLAVGIANGTVQLWDIENPRDPKPAGPATTGPDGIIHSLAFNPDGAILAGGAGGTGQTWMWRVADGRSLDPLAILRGSTTTWNLQFSPDGHVLAAAAGDVYLWETDTQRAIRRICEHTGDGINESEWDRNVPGAPLQRICP